MNNSQFASVKGNLVSIQLKHLVHMGPEHAEQAASPILGPATLVANAAAATNTSLSSASSNFSQRE